MNIPEAVLPKELLPTCAVDTRRVTARVGGSTTDPEADVHVLGWSVRREMVNTLGRWDSARWRSGKPRCVRPLASTLVLRQAAAAAVAELPLATLSRFCYWTRSPQVSTQLGRPTVRHASHVCAMVLDAPVQASKLRLLPLLRSMHRSGIVVYTHKRGARYAATPLLRLTV